jgi:hypothetical protein
VGVRIFPFQPSRQIDFAVSGGQVFLMQKLHARQMFLQRRLCRLGQHRDAILCPFAIAHHDLVRIEIHIFHP